MKKFPIMLLLTAAAAGSQAQGVRIEPNVVFGMYSGLALLMDAYHPVKPNGYGVLYISGSGWHAPQEYSAEPLKQSGQAKEYATRLAGAGYTVFSVTHRAAPRFRYPAAVEDVQRAVRFVRHHAKRYGIRPDRIGAVGGSSGGHLVLMLGTLSGTGDPNSADAVERESAKVQCVVARAAPADLSRMGGSDAVTLVASFIGMPIPDADSAMAVEARTYREASPLSHVSADDAPTLLMHGDRDSVVPFEQSEMMQRAFRSAGVATSLLRVPGGGHGANFAGAINPPDYMGEMIRWLERHLVRGK